MCSPSGTYCSCAIKKITIKLELILTLKIFFTKMGRGREEIDFNDTGREGRGRININNFQKKIWPKRGGGAGTPWPDKNLY